MIKDKRTIFAGHTAPFLLWIGVIFLLPGLQRLGLDDQYLYPWSYAIKTVACAAIFFWLKPWRVYRALKLRNILPALVIGLGVAALWIGPEMASFGRFSSAGQEFYHRWLIMPLGAFPAYYPTLPPGHSSWSYAPQQAGWTLTIMKLIGSSCVIAVVEEFFFRGFLYRWQSRSQFWLQPLTEFDLRPFLITVLVFGVEHDRWFMGLVAGVAYGLFVIWRGDIWAAALAHGVTNFVLGIYVIVTGQYGFW